MIDASDPPPAAALMSIQGGPCVLAGLLIAFHVLRHFEW